MSGHLTSNSRTANRNTTMHNDSLIPCARHLRITATINTTKQTIQRPQHTPHRHRRHSHSSPTTCHTTTRHNPHVAPRTRRRIQATNNKHTRWPHHTTKRSSAVTTHTNNNTLIRYKHHSLKSKRHHAAAPHPTPNSLTSNYSTPKPTTNVAHTATSKSTHIRHTHSSANAIHTHAHHNSSFANTTHNPAHHSRIQAAQIHKHTRAADTITVLSDLMVRLLSTHTNTTTTFALLHRSSSCNTHRHTTAHRNTTSIFNSPSSSSSFSSKHTSHGTLTRNTSANQVSATPTKMPRQINTIRPTRSELSTTHRHNTPAATVPTQRHHSRHNSTRQRLHLHLSSIPNHTSSFTTVTIHPQRNKAFRVSFHKRNTTHSPPTAPRHRHSCQWPTTQITPHNSVATNKTTANHIPTAAPIRGNRYAFTIASNISS